MSENYTEDTFGSGVLNSSFCHALDFIDIESWTSHLLCCDVTSIHFPCCQFDLPLRNSE